MINKTVGLKFLILPLSLAVSVAILVIFIYPKYNNIKNLKQEIGKNKDSLAQLETQVNSLVEMRDSLNSLEEKDIINTALPQGEGMDNFLSEFYARINRSGAVLNSFTVSEETGDASRPYVCNQTEDISSMSETNSQSVLGNDGSIDQSNASGATSLPSLCANTTKIDIAVIGNWEQLVNLLKYASDTTRISNITGIDLSTTQQSAAGEEGEAQLSNNLINLSATMNVYFKPKNDAVGSKLLNVSREGGFNKEVMNKVVNSIYGTFEPPKVDKTDKKNIFY